MYYFLKVFYLGDNYHGSQRQPNLKTVEQHLIDALANTRYIPQDKKINYFFVNACGRTDKGVHALGSVFGFFSLKEEIHPIEINKSLPEDIRIWQYSKVHDKKELTSLLGDNSESSLTRENIKILSKKIKHPRYHAIKRIYRYFMFDWDGKMNPEFVKKTCNILTGHHNFINFSKPEEGRKTIRTIDSISFTKSDKMYLFEFTAPSFQWKQIRKMVGTILKVASGEWPLIYVERLLNPEERELAMKIPIAPAKNLILWDVHYDDVEWLNCSISITEMLDILKDRMIGIQTRHSILENVYGIIEQKNRNHKERN